MITPLTKEQAIILSICTGQVLIQPFKVVLEDVEKRLGRTVHPSEFNNNLFQSELRDLYYEDFMKLMVIVPEIIVIGG